MCGCKDKHKKGRKKKGRGLPKRKQKKTQKHRRCSVIAGIHVCKRKPTRAVVKPRKKRLFIRRRRGKGWDDDDYLANMPVGGGRRLRPKKQKDSMYAFLQ